MDIGPAGNGVLILGSTGFLGSALKDQILRLGYPVHALTRSGPEVQGGHLTQVCGSLDDPDLLRNLLPSCRHVIYAAGQSTPGSSEHSPSLEVTQNLLPLARFLECAKDFPGRRLIYLSSAGAVYGDGARDADEAAALHPRSYYGAGKVAAEALIHACSASSGWEAIVLRPTNIYGPGQAAGKEFAIIPTLLNRAWDGGLFPIWGDGQTVRDYCYIDDFADAVTRLLRQPPPARFAIFNVASGCTATIFAMVSACEAASGRSIRVEHHPTRAVDVPEVSPRAEAITQSYDWRPRVALDQGLAMTWKWFQDSMDPSLTR